MELSPSMEQSPTATDIDGDDDSECDGFEAIDVEAARGGMDEAIKMRSHKKMEKRRSRPFGMAVATDTMPRSWRSADCSLSP